MFFVQPRRQEMSKRMEKNDVLCVDVGDVTLWASLSACLTKGQRPGAKIECKMSAGLCLPSAWERWATAFARASWPAWFVVVRAGPW